MAHDECTLEGALLHEGLHTPAVFRTAADQLGACTQLNLLLGPLHVPAPFLQRAH
jgi:hypothetical protein